MKYSFIVWECERKLLTSLLHNLLQTRIGPASAYHPQPPAAAKITFAECLSPGGRGFLFPQARLKLGRSFLHPQSVVSSSPLHSSPLRSVVPHGWMDHGWRAASVSSSARPRPASPSLSQWCFPSLATFQHCPRPPAFRRCVGARARRPLPLGCGVPRKQHYYLQVP